MTENGGRTPIRNPLRTHPCFACRAPLTGDHVYCGPCVEAVPERAARQMPKPPVVHTGYAIDMLDRITEPIDLLVTDPPYAMGGEGAEHAMSATVATTLRELGHRVRRGGWAVVYAASSWRSTYYMVESLRGVLEPVRIGTWCKPVSRSKVRTPGWAWASVNVITFKRPGRGETLGAPSPELDYIVHAPLTVGRRAQLPPEVARWSVDPFVTEGGLAVDPFAGSGALLDAAHAAGMTCVGFDVDPLVARPDLVPFDYGDGQLSWNYAPRNPSADNEGEVA